MMTAKFHCWFALSLSLLTLAGLSGLAHAETIQQGDGPRVKVRITGKLLDFREAPIANATIGLARWDAIVWHPLGQSSEAGDFTLRVRLQPGGYRVIAGFGAYEVASQYLMILKSGKRDLEIRLHAAENSARSDLPPGRTPAVGELPSGSFPPADPFGPLQERWAESMRQSQQRSAQSMHQSQERIEAYLRDVQRSNRAEQPPGFPAPPPPQPKAGEQEFVNVFYVTNRSAVSGQPGHFVDGRDAQPASYGICKVSIPPTHQPGQLERPSIWRFERVENVNAHIVIAAREMADGEASFQEKLRRAFQEGGSEAFLFIHGYNVAFDDAVRRTAQLFRDLRFNGVPILFSWPAQDAWWRYTAAEDTVQASARQLEAFLLHTLADQRLTAVNVIAHSMGNRVLAAALDRLALAKSNARFNNIVMAAPDVNIADFDAISGFLQSNAARTTIYSSSRDVALLASKAFHSYTRIGEAPPVRLVAGIDTVDASAISGDILGHSYFDDTAQVFHDLFLLVAKGLDPQARLLQPASLGPQRYWIVKK